MNWLARLDIEADVARDEGIFDNYLWHKKLWECFPGIPGDKRNFLTRIDTLEGAYRLWILAERKPVCPKWCQTERFALNSIAESFLSHRYYAFDLRANPTKCVVQRGPAGETLRRANGKRTHGKRVPLVNPDELRDWLARKGYVRCSENGMDVPGGFCIVDSKPLEISPMVENHFRKKDQAAFHGGVQFRGTLEVTDREAFIESYYRGIGSAKGFGFGLLLLAPINL